MSTLLVWVTVAESHWGSLGVSVELISEFSYPTGKQAGLFIYQLPSPMVEDFFPIHQFHTIPTTHHTHIHTPQACPAHVLSMFTQLEKPPSRESRCWQQEKPVRCSICTEVNWSLSGSDRRLHRPLQSLKALSDSCDSSCLALRHYWQQQKKKWL